jgi:hypothetical protein
LTSLLLGQVEFFSLKEDCLLRRVLLYQLRWQMAGQQSS